MNRCAINILSQFKCMQSRTLLPSLPLSFSLINIFLFKFAQLLTPFVITYSLALFLSLSFSLFRIVKFKCTQSCIPLLSLSLSLLSSLSSYLFPVAYWALLIILHLSQFSIHVLDTNINPFRKHTRSVVISSPNKEGMFLIQI